jgi:hypothetical protein
MVIGKNMVQRFQRASTRTTENRLTLDEDDLRGLIITKTALIKSLMESGQLYDITPDAMVVIENWIGYIYSNSEHDKELITPKTPF